MPRYFINIATRFPNGSQGPGFNFELEAASFVEALELAKPVVVQALKDSGLQEIAAPSAPPAELLPA